MTTILEVKQLTIHRNQQAVISQLDFTLSADERMILQGEIGSGKSTLLLSLLGFIPIQQGYIYWFKQPCQKEADFIPLRGKVGLGFQHAEDQLIGPTVIDDVAFGVLNQGYNKVEAYQMALAQLEKLDIVHLKDRPIHLLSGGEKNFVALAGVLVMRPSVLLLDEPTNGLDSKSRSKLIALLRLLPQPMLIASHDHHFCHQFADSVLLLNKNNNIGENGVTSDFD